MLMGEWIGLGALIASNAGISIGIYKYFNSRLDRVYQRFDEHKTETQNKFVSKEICSVMHKANADNLTGLETRLEKRIDKFEETATKNWQNLDEKITELLKK